MPKAKKDQYVTYGQFAEGVEHIVDKVDEMLDEKLGKVESKIDKKLQKAEHRLSGDIKDLQRQVNDLKYDTPTKKEVDSLDSRVTRLESFHTH